MNLWMIVLKNKSAERRNETQELGKKSYFGTKEKWKQKLPLEIDL